MTKTEFTQGKLNRLLVQAISRNNIAAANYLLRKGASLYNIRISTNLYGGSKEWKQY